MAPYFSIILPVYNVEAYLDRCLRSVLEQSFKDYELILVNDGSKDTSPEICERYASQYNHIQVIHKANGGLSSARNAGLEIARGEYIWWVDSDDYIEPGALKVLYESTRNDFPDMVKFDYYRVSTITQQIHSNANPGVYRGEAIQQELLEKAFFSCGQYILSAWSHVYRRAFLEEMGLRFVSERIVGSEDYLFNLEAIYAAQTVKVLAKPLYDYELRGGSLTQQYKGDLAVRYQKLAAELEDWYRKTDAPVGYLKKVNSFYIWHLIHGTFMYYEYTPTENHTLAQGRENVRCLLKTPHIRRALKECDYSGFGWKQRLQLLAMGMGMESLFYWLYVRKPMRKEKRRYEHQD